MTCSVLLSPQDTKSWSPWIKAYYQQNLTRGRLSVIVLKSRTNQLEDLQPLVNKVLKALEMIKTSELVVIRPSESVTLASRCSGRRLRRMSDR